MVIHIGDTKDYFGLYMIHRILLIASIIENSKFEGYRILLNTHSHTRDIWMNIKLYIFIEKIID